MIIKIANKSLKEPLELYVPELEWKELEKITVPADLNVRLQKLAMNHIAKYGYEIGYCLQQGRRVTLKDCMNCGVNVKGWAKGSENYQKWEKCKLDNIDYQFKPSEPLFRKIKDKAIEEKMKPQTKSEIVSDNTTFSNIERIDDAFERESEKIMNPIHDKEK